MDIGLYASTHGPGYRDEVNFLARFVPAEHMQPVQLAQLAEGLGYHSMWFPDHGCMPMASTSAHVANASGTRAYESRHTMLNAAVVMGAVYKRAWAAEAVSFQDQFYDFSAVSMDPKPVQRPRPPIVYGGGTAVGGRRAARLCDGFPPIFLDPHAEPGRYSGVQDLIRGELERMRKDPAGFTMIGVSSARLTARHAPQARDTPRRICTGTPEQVVADLERFAQAGYSLLVPCVTSMWPTPMRRPRRLPAPPVSSSTRTS